MVKRTSLLPERHPEDVHGAPDRMGGIHPDHNIKKPPAYLTGSFLGKFWRVGQDSTER